MKTLLKVASLSFVMALSACNESVATKPATGSDTTAASASSAAKVSAPQGITNINNAELDKLIDQGVTLVDIRLPEEWAQTGVVRTSKRLTFFSRTGQINPNIERELSAISSKDKPVILICRTGSRTHAGSNMLMQMGFKSVYNVTNGIMGWLGEGRPTVK